MPDFRADVKEIFFTARLIPVPQTKNARRCPANRKPGAIFFIHSEREIHAAPKFPLTAAPKICSQRKKFLRRFGRFNKENLNLWS